MTSSSWEARRLLLAAFADAGAADRPERAPLPVRAEQLTEGQLAGTECIWCAGPITTTDRQEVGSTGRPAIRLYACVECAGTFRLPIWPEPGCL